MGLVRFSDGNGRIRSGYRIDDRIIALCDIHQEQKERGYFESLKCLETTARNLVENGEATGRDVANTQILLPVEPENIVRLEGCYQQDVTDDGYNSRIEKDGLNRMDWPSSWTAPRSSAVGPRGALAVPRYVSDVRPGVELGLVIGTETKQCDIDTARTAIAGVTASVCLTIHDELPGLELYKMFDNCMAVGPQVVPTASVSLESTALQLKHKNKRLATHRTDEWRFDPAEMVSHVSRIMTLNPGDIVFTGDPTRTAISVSPGDTVGVAIEGVGSMTVPITNDKQINETT